MTSSEEVSPTPSDTLGSVSTPSSGFYDDLQIKRMLATVKVLGKRTQLTTDPNQSLMIGRFELDPDGKNAPRAFRGLSELTLATVTDVPADRMMKSLGVRDVQHPLLPPSEDRDMVEELWEDGIVAPDENLKKHLANNLHNNRAGRGPAHGKGPAADYDPDADPEHPLEKVLDPSKNLKVMPLLTRHEMMVRTAKFPNVAGWEHTQPKNLVVGEIRQARNITMPDGTKVRNPEWKPRGHGFDTPSATDSSELSEDEDDDSVLVGEGKKSNQSWFVD